MKKAKYRILSAVAALIVGIILVLFPNEAGNYFVITIGLLFLIPSCLNIVSYFNLKKEYRVFFPIDAIGGILFGFLLMVMPSFFADFLTLVLGFLVLMGGLQQFVSLIAARQWSHVPVLLYFVPLLIVIAGLVAVFNPMGTRSAAFIIIGACCIAYGLTSIMNWYKYLQYNPEWQKTVGNANETVNSGNGGDVEYPDEETDFADYNQGRKKKYLNKDSNAIEDAEIVE